MAHQPVIGTLNWIMMPIYTFYDTIKYPNALIHINQLIKSNRKHFSTAASVLIPCTNKESKKLNLLLGLFYLDIWNLAITEFLQLIGGWINKKMPKVYVMLQFFLTWKHCCQFTNTLNDRNTVPNLMGNVVIAPSSALNLVYHR